MPHMLSTQKRIAKAKALIEQAQTLPEPPPGHMHGGWLLRVKALLRRAERVVRTTRVVVDGRRTMLDGEPEGRELLDDIARCWTERITSYYKRKPTRW